VIRLRSESFVDHTLPPGRPQGPAGPAAASKAFLAAVPDLKVVVSQQILAGDRVVFHLRFTGHFTGQFKNTKGIGQPVDFIATDILSVQGDRITDNWHLEDNLTFLRQIGLMPRRALRPALPPFASLAPMRGDSQSAVSPVDLSERSTSIAGRR